MVMFMSGARTGKVDIPRGALLTLKALRQARTGFAAAAAGTTSPGTAARPIAAAAPRATGASASVFALPGHIRFWFFTFSLFGGEGKARTPQESPAWVEKGGIVRLRNADFPELICWPCGNT